jgi:hypothetical protein
MQSKGFRYLVKEVYDLWKERQHIHRALRLLNKQEWSIEFLTALLVRAANTTKQPLEMIITGPGGITLQINTIRPETSIYKDDDIMNHLDDDLRIKQFMDSLK